LNYFPTFYYVHKFLQSKHLQFSITK